MFFIQWLVLLFFSGKIIIHCALGNNHNFFFQSIFLRQVDYTDSIFLIYTIVYTKVSQGRRDQTVITGTFKIQKSRHPVYTMSQNIFQLIFIFNFKIYFKLLSLQGCLKTKMPRS